MKKFEKLADRILNDIYVDGGGEWDGWKRNLDESAYGRMVVACEKFFTRNPLCEKELDQIFEAIGEDENGDWIESDFALMEHWNELRDAANEYFF